ncbi:arrestin domain protein [Dictyocaulus viviparus]|uniref:Arrestin domain protein n=1 Tax=Dictyocaulus viviparus TaxID=29172 RepID=A0A0D8XAT7_DICVI|nr:arrestin domain protein [Dictyocaulus viviparus]
MVINAVKLQLKGRAIWLNDPLKNDNIEKVYFDQDFTLLERPPGKPEPGHFTWIGGFPYSLPFECPLPKGCPASYEGPYAFIRYFIKASIIHEQEDGGTKEYYVKKAFSIVPVCEGQVIKGEPVVVNELALYGSCCCKKKISAELILPKTVYLPGEVVVGTLKIGDKFPKDILQHVEIRLVDRVFRVGAPEKLATSPCRTLFCRKNQPTKITKRGREIWDNLYLLTIPALFLFSEILDPLKNEIRSIKTCATVVESPSTATLRLRKQPFIKIEYAIQVSLGNSVMLEAPITIGELSLHDSTTILKPFVGGPQPIEEVDETQRISIGGPFMYTPMYAILKNSDDVNCNTDEHAIPMSSVISTDVGSLFGKETITRQQDITTTNYEISVPNHDEIDLKTPEYVNDEEIHVCSCSMHHI